MIDSWESFVCAIAWFLCGYMVARIFAPVKKTPKQPTHALDWQPMPRVHALHWRLDEEEIPEGPTIKCVAIEMDEETERLLQQQN